MFSNGIRLAANVKCRVVAKGRHAGSTILREGKRHAGGRNDIRNTVEEVPERDDRPG